ncbi:MAG: redoxin domain-containing protein [Bacteroidales bacterium]|nr:redoxin domain-containing protein [Bacteroidales bacterium]
MKHLTLLILVFFSLIVNSQEYKFNAIIKFCPEENIILTRFYGDQILVVDSLTPEKSGEIEFKFSANTASGIYRLVFSDEKILDFIFNKENIELSSHYNYIMDSVKVKSSTENILFYKYLRRKRDFEIKMELISPLIDYYPRTDMFYWNIVYKFDELQFEWREYLDSLSKNCGQTYVARISRMEKTPSVSSDLSGQERSAFFKQHFFDDISFGDTSLFRSNVFSGKIIEYLSLYSNPRLSQSELEDEFINATNVLLAKVSDDPTSYEFVLNYLVNGFEKFHFDKVLEYISENFVLDGKCEDEKRKSMLEKRLAKYKELANGKAGPEIVMKDIEGKEFVLSQLDADYTLLVFWASWCPHCLNVLPEIKKLYEDDNVVDFKVVAISVDTSANDWKKEINNGGFNWINCSDLNGWNSKAADDYNIYATPSMVLLDKQKTIISKPITKSELKKAIKALNK